MDPPLRSILTAAAVLATLQLAGCAGVGGVSMDDLLTGALPSTARPLDEPTVASGLKEALQVGARNAVQSTSRLDGFQANDLIRIALPPELEKMSSGLRAIGFGSQVDELELTMNRAAEGAAGEATEVFIDAITGMSFQDAMGILKGEQDAATQYLRRTTGDTLRTRFRPIVDGKMREVGLVSLYDNLVGRLRALPLVPKPELDLQGYVTDKTLDGLFHVVAEEEGRIRTDPSARVTDLLRTVFGN
jgi:hypothetical protein